MGGRSSRARSQPHLGSALAGAAFQLYVLAMEVTLALVLPLVCTIALTGVVISLLQTAFGIQDQNIAFAPKIAVIALLIATVGENALGALVHLLTAVFAGLPRLG